MRRIKSWPIQKDLEVELYWHGMPYLNSEGLWMIKCLFKKLDGKFIEGIFPFGTLPHLRIGQYYLNGDFSEKCCTGSLFEVKVNSYTKFEICKGFDFPKSLYAFDKPPAPGYGNLYLCKFEVSGIYYYIPCTEILRSILVPKKLFANRILRPDGLDCFVESNYGLKNKLELKFTDEYPLEYMKDEDISYFVWLKFDKSASKTWNSVYKNVMLEASNRSNGDIISEFKKGVPIKTLPPVSGQSTWTFRGLAFRNHRLIFELTHRSNLDIPFSIIECFHPKLERLEGDDKPRYVKDKDNKLSDNQEIELDTTGQGAERNPGNIIIEQPPIMFSFKRKPRIIRKSNKKRTIHGGEVIVVGTKQDCVNEDTTGTAQDWVLGGKIPQIEFDILKMVDSNLSKGLEDFLKLVSVLQKNHKDFDISLNIIYLPGFKNFSRYEDGDIRTCAIVRIERQKYLPCYIIEIGRVDDWSISTLIIKPTDNNSADIKNFESFLHNLLWNLVINNGHWEREFFRSENNYEFDTAKHISGQPIIRWAERVIEKLL